MRVPIIDEEAMCSSDSGGSDSDYIASETSSMGKFIASEDEVDDLLSTSSDESIFSIDNAPISGIVRARANRTVDNSSKPDEKIKKKKPEGAVPPQSAGQKRQIDSPVGPPALKKGRGRPKKVVEGGGSQVKLPGDASFPLNDFSLTVSKTSGGDIPMPTSLDAIQAFIVDYCVKGAVSTEVGSRAFHLHLQGVLRLRYPKTADYVSMLQKFIKNLLPNKGKGLKVMLKVLRGDQTFIGMIGYVTKDVGQPHYQLRTHGITVAELAEGRNCHSNMVTSSYDESRKVITVKNLMQELFKFNRRCMMPIIVPVLFGVTYMIQSGNYILSPDFISSYRKIDLHEAEILWGMINKPKDTTVEGVRALLFDPRSYSPKINRRYFFGGQDQAEYEEERRRPDVDLTAMAADYSEEERRHHQPQQEAASSTDKEKGRRCLAQKLVDLCKEGKERLTSSSLSSSRPAYFDEDFVAMRDEEYEVEDSNNRYQVDNDSYVCPDTLEEMLLIVRNARKRRLQWQGIVTAEDILRQQVVEASMVSSSSPAKGYPPASAGVGGGLLAHVVSPPRAPKLRMNNYDNNNSSNDMLFY
eukprot:gene27563-33289_t